MSYTLIHLVKFTLLCGLLVASFFLLSVTRAHAYLATDTQAVKLGNNSALFLIEYEFGRVHEELHMPILAKEGTERTNNIVSYEILDGDNNEVRGKSVGIVLSTAEIRDNSYITPKNEGKRFVLFVLFTPEVMEGVQEYHLQVTQLPFNLNGTIEQQLNPSELKYYKTDSVEL